MAETFKFHRYYFLVLAVLLAPNTSILAESVDLTRPFTLSDQHPLSLSHLSFRADEARLLGHGAIELSLSAHWSNTVNSEKGVFLVDAETRVVEFSFALGLFDNAQIRARQSILNAGDGITDEFIDDWHQVFSLPRGPRSRLPRDRFEISGVTTNGEPFKIEEAGTSLGQTELEGSLAIIRDSQLQVSLRLQAGLPTGANSFSHQSTDLGASLLTSLSLYSWNAYGSAHYLYYPVPEYEELRLRNHRVGSSLGIGYLASEHLGLFLGLNIFSELITNVPQYPSYQVYLDANIRYALSTRTQIEINVRENPGPEDSTTDVCLSIGLSSRFAAQNSH